MNTSYHSANNEIFYPGDLMQRGGSSTYVKSLTGVPISIRFSAGTAGLHDKKQRFYGASICFEHKSKYVATISVAVGEDSEHFQKMETAFNASYQEALDIIFSLIKAEMLIGLFENVHAEGVRYGRKEIREGVARLLGYETF